ncbi:MAG: replicative DNA helicase [Chloroflexi bacterium]|jgi:replicative DNA helicase|nr:replicative DNA helicase [Dehalococcoidia bacterium]PCJ74900.1 MAG: replicative DNA helicase [Dehalococcoidia bacterium]PKB80299.1 MAG: replicative DNA helicase [SAR202 cluster bacterium MP-SInd-SRR3963457-G1]RUA21230.1 MAG: replicative DNA helicase [Chloroflexota bacterium]RUA33390.1 MAG: replicative DNA helicase [Chloroflexota bacterium]
MYAEKLLPHDLEAEEAVVGSVLIDGDCFSRVAPYIKADDFYRERNQLCFAACEALFQRNEAIDQVTLARELSRSSQLETVGGMAYLSHLISVTPTSVHSEHYANVVARTATMRKLIDVASRISTLGYQDTDDIDATLRQAEDALFTVRGTESQRGFMPLRQIYDQYLEDQAAFADVLTDKSGPVMTGYSELDELLGGIQRSDLVILGARPSLGKSALALNASVNAAKNGSTVGVFSLEMSRDQLAMRILSAEAEIDSHRLRLGLLTDAQSDRITDAIGRLSDLPVYIDDTPSQSMIEMRSKARRLSLEHGLDLLVVDYLQLIQGRSGRSDNRVQEISEISRSLKIMARDLDIALITCSQLSRGVEQRPSHRPMLSDLRDSGSIEQDADVVMFLHRDDLYMDEDEWARQFPGRAYPRNIADLIVAKHRNGPTGTVQLYFRDNWVRFDSYRQVDEF